MSFLLIRHILHTLLALTAVLLCSCAAINDLSGGGAGKNGDALLRKSINDNTARTLSRYGSRKLFKKYSSKGSSRWSPRWAGEINFTGVAWNGKQAGVLISPQHVLMATHHQRRKGSLLVFHDSAGSAHRRELTDVIELPGNLDPDISVGLLNKPVPVQYYSVLAPVSILRDYSRDLKKCYIILSHADRKASVAEVAGLAWRRILLRHSKSVPKVFQQKIVKGDSGHPIFILLNNELVLVSMHCFGGNGAGPFLSEQENFSQINQAMKLLGGNYQLQTARLPFFYGKAKQKNRIT